MGQQTSSAFDRALLGYPSDLGVVSVLALAFFVALPVLEGPLRLALSLPLITFLPGYALVSVLFPTRARQGNPSFDATWIRPHGIDSIERLALGFGLSLVIVPILVMMLPLVGIVINTYYVVAMISGTTFALAQLAAIRRLSVPSTERYVVTLDSLPGAVGFTGDVDASSVALGVSVLLAVGTLLVGLTMPLSAGGYTEFALYGDNESGSQIVGEIPPTAEPGEPISYSLGIENHEGESMDYTIVTQEQHIDDGTVTDRIELDRTTVSVADGGERTLDRQLLFSEARPEPVRVRFLLYAGEPPAVPTENNALEDVYFFMTVQEP